jgi:glycosyltransferase involved in cell wall biosynthesis
MNIAHLSTASSWRGGEVQSFYLAQGLTRHGYKNYLIAQARGALAKISTGLSKGSDAPIFLFNRAYQPEIISIRMRGELDIQAIWKIAQILRRKQAHILHMHTAHAITLGSLAGKIARVPGLIISRRIHFPLRSPFLSRFKYQWGIDKIIAVSQEVKNQLIRDGIAEDKIAVVHSGVDLSQFNPDVPFNQIRQELAFSQNIPLVGIIGHLVPEKGQALVIQAVPEILKEVPEARFLLVGDGPQRHVLQSQIDTLGLNKVVYLLGFRWDIPEILADLDILVAPSTSTEGSPGSIKEAMAMGKPVIALNLGFFREIITDGIEGILLPYNEFGKNSAREEVVRELVKAVVSLLKDKEKRQELGQSAFKKIQMFSMDKMIEGTETIYLEVLRGKGLYF